MSAVGNPFAETLCAPLFVLYPVRRVLQLLLCWAFWGFWKWVHQKSVTARLSICFFMRSYTKRLIRKEILFDNSRRMSGMNVLLRTIKESTSRVISESSVLVPDLANLVVSFLGTHLEDAYIIREITQLSQRQFYWSKRSKTLQKCEDFCKWLSLFTWALALTGIFAQARLLYLQRPKGADATERLYTGVIVAVIYTGISFACIPWPIFIQHASDPMREKKSKGTDFVDCCQYFVCCISWTPLLALDFDAVIYVPVIGIVSIGVWTVTEETFEWLLQKSDAKSSKAEVGCKLAAVCLRLCLEWAVAVCVVGYVHCTAKQTPFELGRFFAALTAANDHNCGTDGSSLFAFEAASFSWREYAVLSAFLF